MRISRLTGLTAAVIVFSVLALAYLSPILSNFNSWGFYDWDQHFFYHGSPRLTMAKYFQFPLWNPYYCGGAPGLANPQSPFLSPFFLFVMVFGTVAGLKLEILAYLIVGLVGTFLLSKRLGMQGLAAYYPAIVFMLSSWFATRVKVGHTTFLPFALLPFALLFYLKALEDKRFLVLSATAMALMFLGGGVYPAAVALMIIGAYALMQSLEARKFSPLLAFAAIVALFLLFSAVKLIPMAEYTASIGFGYEDTQKTGVDLFLLGLTSRSQHIESVDELIRPGYNATDAQVAAVQVGQLPWGFHEYSAYIGFIPLLLALAAFIDYKRNWKLIALLIVFGLLALGDFSPVNLNIWSLLRQLPLFSGLHGPSRFAIGFVFIAALLGGNALSRLKWLRSKWVVLALIALVALDLILVARPNLEDTFTRAPMQIAPGEYNTYIQLYSSVKYLVQYPNLLQNIGTWNCYERVHPKISAVPQFFDTGDAYEGFRGNAYIAEANQSLELASFSPNKVKVIVTVSQPSTLVLNQNYDRGWKANGKEVINFNGLVATSLTPDDKEITFYYQPLSFIIGGLLTLISQVLVALWLKSKGMRGLLDWQ